jgi:hypothetical protein
VWRFLIVVLLRKHVCKNNEKQILNTSNLHKNGIKSENRKIYTTLFQH